MTIQLPATIIWDLDGCQQNFDWIGALGIAGGAGTVSLTFSGGTTAATATVTHGLGGIPSEIVFGAAQTLTVITQPFVVTGSINAQTFQVGGLAASALTATIKFSWVASL